MNHPPKIAVRCRYYKRQSALAVLDHAHHKRNGFTHSQNVKAELSHHNMGFYFHGANSCTEALELLCKKHKEIMGKKVRADNNILFEHIIIFSEAQYKKLESKFSPARINKAMIAKLKSYAMSIKAQFGFEPLGIDLHLDEGRYESSPNSKKKNFIRNIHAHVQFMNFDFSADKLFAPLRHLMTKGKDKNGKTLQLNPHFEKIQNIAFEHFKLWGFKRGVSKNITGAEHLNKEAYVQQRLAVARRQSVILKEKIEKFAILLAEKSTELEEVVGRVKKLTSKKRRLEEEVAEYTTLKIELSEAIQQKSELALQRIRNKLKSLTKGPNLHR